MMVFRSVLVPLKAALMNLLGIGAAYGVLVAVFVGQISKLTVCRVGGNAGGAKKYDWPKSELSIDEAIDY